MDGVEDVEEVIVEGKRVGVCDVGLLCMGMRWKGEDRKEKVRGGRVEGVEVIVRKRKRWRNGEVGKKWKIEE